MTEFQIDRGSKWAGNFFKRHTSGVSGLTTRDNLSYRLSLDLSNTPEGTTIKLCGVVNLRFSCNRVRYGGMGQLFSFSHEDSDRVIATNTGNNIRLRTYAYRRGLGPATTSDSFSQKLGFVSHNQPFELEFVELDNKTLTRLLGRRTVQTPREKPPSLFKHKTFAHAVGYKQDESPGNISIKVYDTP